MQCIWFPAQHNAVKFLEENEQSVTAGNV